MPISISGWTADQRRDNLQILLQATTESGPRTVIQEIFTGQEISNIRQLLVLKDPEIESMTLRTKTTVTKDNKEVEKIETTEVAKIHLSLIKDLRNYMVFLMSPENITFNDVTKVQRKDFEAWQDDALIQSAKPPAPAPTPTTGTTTTASTGVDTVRLIEAVSKLDMKSIPHWNGSVGEYPRTWRLTRQALKNFGMVEFLDANKIPPTNDGSNKWLLWDKRSEFITTALMTRFTGGQAAVIIREESDNESAGLIIIKAIILHYESPANQAAAVTHVTGKLSQLKYTSRSNFSLSIHLSKFQHLLLDLDDIKLPGGVGTAKPTAIQIKSHLCNSINHPAFQNMIDQYLTDASKDHSIMITELTQKAERMSNTNVSRRNLNNSRSNRGNNGNNNNRNNNRNANGRNGNNNNSDRTSNQRNSEWWKPPHVWRAMSAEEKRDWNRRKAEARRQQGGNNDGNTSTPVPASNYGNLGTIETVMQLLTLTDDQRQQLQQTTAQVAQIQSLLQTPVASHINAATTNTASTATPLQATLQRPPVMHFLLTYWTHKLHLQLHFLLADSSMWTPS